MDCNFIDFEVLNNFCLKDINEISKTRWEEIFIDKDNYKIGLYSPEFSSLKEIKKLEKHDGPEVFILLQGKVNLLVFDGKKKKVIKLKKFRPVIINDYHNGFSPPGKKKGICLVIEKDNIKSEFLEI